MKRLIKPWNNRRNHLKWQQSLQKEEALLIGYLIAGDPSQTESLQIIDNAFHAGMDIIELGIPSNHPNLDGEVIQRGHARVMEKQPDSAWLIDYCSKLRKRVDQPIWAMGYRDDLYLTGLYRTLAEQDLIDAFLIPDCSLEEHEKMAQELRHVGVDVARFVNDAMSESEMAQVCKDATLIYAQSYPGKTGKSDANMSDLSGLYKRIRTHTTSAFLMVGFGIRSPEKVKIAVKSGFQGVVVGSAFVEQLEKRAYQSLYQLIVEMKQEARSHFKNKIW